MTQTKSTKIENVNCVIGQNTKKPNTITMRIAEADILEAVALFKTLREGNKPETGLIGYELIAVYADESDVDNEVIELDLSGAPVQGDELIDGMADSLDSAMGGEQ